MTRPRRPAGDARRRARRALHLRRPRRPDVAVRPTPALFASLRRRYRRHRGASRPAAARRLRDARRPAARRRPTTYDAAAPPPRRAAAVAARPALERSSWPAQPTRTPSPSGRSPRRRGRAVWRLQPGETAETWPGAPELGRPGLVLRERTDPTRRTAARGLRLREIPEISPKAEDADRMGCGQHSIPCRPTCGGGRSRHAQSCNRRQMRKPIRSSCSCNARSCRMPRVRTPRSTPRSRRPARTSGISREGRDHGVRGRPRCGRPARRGSRCAGRGSPASPRCGRPRRRRRAGPRRRRSAPGRSRRPASIAAPKASGEGFVHGISLV